MIHKTAIIDPSVKIGEDTRIWAFVQIRENAVIGKNCTIGNGSYVDKGVRVGNNVQMINKVLVHRGVEIEDDVFLGPLACFINDRNPRHYQERDLSGEVWRVKRGASVGAGALICSNVNIGSYALVGAGAIVTKNVPDHGLVYGSPAKLAGFVCFCGQRLSLDNPAREDENVKFVCGHCRKEVFIKAEDLKQMSI